MNLSNLQFFDLVMYQDQSVFVINKPAGLVVHGDAKTDVVTLADLIARDCPELVGVGENMEIEYKGARHEVPRPGIVHRLDKDTSGCLIIARTPEAYEHLKNQFQQRTIEKTYRLFTYGVPKESIGKIDVALGKSTNDMRKWAPAKVSRGEVREALTYYNVLGTAGLPEGEYKGSTEPNTFAYIEARPKTGRTHQLRVHFKYINHPIVGDSLYATKRPKALGFKRLALHSHSISFVSPHTGSLLCVTAPLPNDFLNVETQVEPIEKTLL